MSTAEPEQSDQEAVETEEENLQDEDEQEDEQGGEG